MKKILVPTDFSACANIASETAIQMARLSNAEILFLHYMSIPVDWVHMEGGNKMYPDISKNVKQVTNQLERLVSLAEKQGVKARHNIGFNDNPSKILPIIEGFGIDMIVMGSHGARGLKEFFPGSNAQKVIRYASVPVLIIKKKLEQADKPTLVFISDFEIEALPAFKKIMEFAHFLQASIQLVYLNTPNDFHDTWTIKGKMEKFRSQIKNKPCVMQIIDAFDFEEGLTKYCNGLKGGIIAMVTHHHKGLFHRNEKAERVVNHLELPFYSVNG